MPSSLRACNAAFRACPSFGCSIKASPTLRNLPSVSFTKFPLYLTWLMHKLSKVDYRTVVSKTYTFTIPLQFPSSGIIFVSSRCPIPREVLCVNTQIGVSCSWVDCFFNSCLLAKAVSSRLDITHNAAEIPAIFTISVQPEQANVQVALSNKTVQSSSSPTVLLDLQWKGEQVPLGANWLA